jgi:hypothetical protein
LFAHAIFVEALSTVIKLIPAVSPVIFKPLEKSPQSDQTLAKEAKTLNNAEKGYVADERYLGEQQNLAQKLERFAQTGEGPFDDADYDEVRHLQDDIPW